MTDQPEHPPTEITEIAEPTSVERPGGNGADFFTDHANNPPPTPPERPGGNGADFLTDQNQASGPDISAEQAESHPVAQPDEKAPADRPESAPIEAPTTDHPATKSGDQPHGGQSRPETAPDADSPDGVTAQTADDHVGQPVEGQPGQSSNSENPESGGAIEGSIRDHGAAGQPQNPSDNSAQPAEPSGASRLDASDKQMVKDAGLGQAKKEGVDRWSPASLTEENKQLSPGSQDETDRWQSGEVQLQPSHRLDAKDYPFLQPADWSTTEAQAVPCLPPETTAELAPNPDGRLEPDHSKRATFDGVIEPATMKAGTPYYRIVGDKSVPNGEFWTDHVPDGDSEIRGDMAIKNEWNGDHGIIQFVPNRDIPCWEGRVAPQAATNSDSAHLAGGGYQIYVGRGSIADNDGMWDLKPLAEWRRD